VRRRGKSGKKLRYSVKHVAEPATCCDCEVDRHGTLVVPVFPASHNPDLVDEFGSPEIAERIAGRFARGFLNGVLRLVTQDLNSRLPPSLSYIREFAKAMFDTSGKYQWSRHFGDIGSQFGRSVAVDEGGNTYLTGDFGGTMNFGGEDLVSVDSADLYLAKFDSAGTHQWSKSFGDAEYQYGRSVAVGVQGSVYLTGEFGGTMNFGGEDLVSGDSADLYLAKFDSAGEHQWSKNFGDAEYQYGRSVAVDAQDSLYLTGEFGGGMNLGGEDLVSAGSTDLYLAKFDSAGTHVWSRHFGDIGSQFGRSVAVDAGGNAYLTGYFEGTMNLGGEDLVSEGSWEIFLAKFVY